jgi:hypothetical protein
MDITSLPESVRDEALQRALSCEPQPLAILVSGSYAQGRARLESDLDLVVITEREPKIPYRTWFAERPPQPLHISVAFEQLEAWHDRYHEPAVWSLGLPTATPTPYLWRTARAVAALGEDPILRRPAAGPELEDFVEAAVKTVGAIRDGEHPRARWHGRSMAELAPRLLLPLNPERRVAHPWEAVQAALTLPVAPDQYREDMEICLGIIPVDDRRFADAAVRLPRALLAFLRRRKPDVDPQPWLAQSLRDGTLQRLLET